MIVKLSLAGMKHVVGSTAEFDFTQQTMNLDLKREGISNVGPVRVKGKIENLGDRVFQADGQIEVTATGLCSRCLTQTKVRFAMDFSLKFSDILAQSEELIKFDGEEIELYPQVVNEIILNCPSQILCKTDCKGLCPKCGANLNTSICKCETENLDPRFAVLKKLLKSE
ncbi:MAG: DUF177 domain-containing protein [Tepidanaerobacter acetatoxydans]|uniref:YceD family protein n=1 Tax=Tepidanaerobacter TaxID=499228 RepID=UPI0025E5E5F8|nr:MULTISPECIES: DUF177 domain-containing protein [Tepidanaerobacter]NLU11388.1 DUF177 domain-containing protein [Tepidanaerobacter acetatoxydans]